jgi:NADH:ubiquinone oxidoreductase subunit E
MQQIDDILFQFGRERGNLLPILHEIQNRFGYLSRESLEAVADYLHLSDGTLYSVASSYPGFKFTPSGRRCINVCRGTACHVKGGKQILSEMERRLGIKPGQTTADMEYSLDTIACTGACSLAPVVIVDNEPHGEMTARKVEGLLGDSYGGS